MLRRVVLTGGIATGKSYALAQFAARGVPTTDADQLAHATFAPSGPAWQPLRERFGPSIFDDQRQVNRRKLGSLVFADDSARKDLNAIVHPYVRRAIDCWFNDLEHDPGHRFGLVAIPLFYEGESQHGVDRGIVTACANTTQRDRVIGRGFTPRDADRRIAAQLPTEEKIERGDFTIWTDGTYDATDQQVQSIYSALCTGGG